MMIGGLCESPLTMRALILLARRAQRRQDTAARRHRSRRHLWQRVRRGADRRGGAEARRRSPRARSPTSRARRRRPRAQLPRRRGRRGGRGRLDLAGGDGGGAEAQRARDPRDDRAALQEAAQAPGAAPRHHAGRRGDHQAVGAQIREAQGADDRGDEERPPQQRPHRASGRSALRAQPPHGRGRGQAAAARRGLRRQAPGLPQPPYGPGAQPRLGRAGEAAARQGLGLAGQQARQAR